MYTSVITSVLAASALVSAAPMQRRETTMMTPSTQLDAAGAVYFITNEGDDNLVIAASINADGTLNLDRAVTTGGSGAHGITDPNGPDALFSQGAIKASAKGQVLATVNSGSNTISLFSIDPSMPTDIQKIGNPVSSEGEFPMSLAFNEDGSVLCALNGGTVNAATANSATIDNDIATIGDKDFLYVLAPNATSIDVLSLESAGNTKHVQTLDISGPTKAAGVTINALNLQGMTHFIV